MTSAPSARVAAVILAGGRSTRMAKEHKLLAALGGRPLIQHAVETALASRAAPVLVVLGHAAPDVSNELAARVTGPGEVAVSGEVVVVENRGYASGLASSLVAGIQALPDEVDGCVVMLADMPFVRPEDVDALIDAFDGAAPCVPVTDGRWANPVLWPKAYFDRIVRLSGDHGARRILEEERNRVVEVPLANPGLLFDVDTPEDLARARSRIPPSGRDPEAEGAAGTTHERRTP